MGLLDKISKKKTSDDKAADEKDTKVKAVAAKKDDTSTTKKATKKDEVKAAETDKKDDKKKGSAKKANAAVFAYNIIRHPVLTEKGDRGQMNGKYTFFVSIDTNKVEIARAIYELYGVKPVSVHVQNLKGKAVRFGRMQGSRKDRKKAIVTLKPGDIISVTE
ncbi:MAG: 50S ribosomal protein L23 [Patescibacteria group bacterium]